MLGNSIHSSIGYGTRKRSSTFSLSFSAPFILRSPAPPLYTTKSHSRGTTSPTHVCLSHRSCGRFTQLDNPPKPLPSYWPPDSFSYFLRLVYTNFIHFLHIPYTWVDLSNCYSFIPDSRQQGRRKEKEKKTLHIGPHKRKLPRCFSFSGSNLQAGVCIQRLHHHHSLASPWFNNICLDRSPGSWPLES